MPIPEHTYSPTPPRADRGSAAGAVFSAHASLLADVIANALNCTNCSVVLVNIVRSNKLLFLFQTLFCNNQ